jgi:3-dehydroquinate dehydratase
MRSTELRVDKRSCRICVDYNKLKNNYKIKPFFDTNYPDKSEREERVYATKYNIKTGIDIKPSLIDIEILNLAPYEEELDSKKQGVLNSHHPDENTYLNDKITIDKIYNEYKNKIYNLKLKLPIRFVDKYKPVL